MSDDVTRFLQQINERRALEQARQAQLARAQAARAAPDNPQEQERLFQQFIEWTKQAFRNVERVRSHLPVVVTQGQTVVRAGGSCAK